MSRTPYSPFVLNETAPLPWNAGLVGGVMAWARGRSSIPSGFVGIEHTRNRESGSTILWGSRWSVVELPGPGFDRLLGG